VRRTEHAVGRVAIVDLRSGIIESRRREIAQMEDILDRLD
jgi:uncharacterized protein (DUF305 family)